MGGKSPGLPQLITVANIYCVPCARVLQNAFYAHHLINSHLLPMKWVLLFFPLCRWDNRLRGVSGGAWITNQAVWLQNLCFTIMGSCAIYSVLNCNSLNLGSPYTMNNFLLRRRGMPIFLPSWNLYRHILFRKALFCLFEPSVLWPDMRRISFLVFCKFHRLICHWASIWGESWVSPTCLPCLC